MKKHLLSIFGLLAACSISATQYMHVNLPNGKEYDVKVEKTDKVSHEKIGDEVYIKVERKDNSYALYPIDGVEITFDDEIARVNSKVSNWITNPSLIEGCVLDTSKLQEAREKYGYIYEEEIASYLYYAQKEYSSCLEIKRKELGTFLDETEVEIQHSANKNSTEALAKISQGVSHKDKNVILSPTSLQFALAMLVNGTDNDNSYAELTTALGSKNVDLDQLNKLYSKRMINLTAINQNKVKIGVANATFLQDGITFGKSFLQDLDEFYKATASNVDFSQDSTYKIMDKWAEENTNGMIPSIGIEKNSALKLVIANALSFQSEWKHKFSKEATKPGKFITSKGGEIEVDKMNCWVSGDYAEGSNYQLTTLSFYEGFEMNIILPNEGVSPLEVLEDFDIDNVKYKYGEVTEKGLPIIYYPKLSLPKFNIDTKINLNEALQTMGLDRSLVESYDKIAKNIIVEKITQQAHLEIDEDGAKGAAVTTVSMAGSALVEEREVDFDVNRPFIVTINNPSNHELLFVGLINDPTLK